MSEDPKGFDAGDYNLFRYCKNDPLDLTDPMGLLPLYVPQAQPYIGMSPMEGDVSRLNCFASAVAMANAGSSGVGSASSRAEQVAPQQSAKKAYRTEAYNRAEASATREYWETTRNAIQKIGPKAKSVDEVINGYKEVLRTRYHSEPQVRETTDANNRVKILYNDPNPYTREATARHIAVHTNSRNELAQRFGGMGSPEYMRQLLNPQRWAKEEVQAHSAAINYIQSLERRWYGSNY